MAAGLGKGKGKVNISDLITLDVSDLDALREMLQLVRTYVSRTYMKGKPEFGAYMHYSVYLESGTKKMRARPHIRPAVFANSKALADGAVKLLEKHMRDMIQSWKVPDENDVKQYWEQMLNGPVRDHALDSARNQRVYQYGFHMRSIMGHYNAPSPSAKKAFAMQQAATRKMMDLAARQKKTTRTKN